MSESPNRPASVPTAVTAVLPNLIHAKDAAEALALSPRALWTLTKQGRIPCVRIGRAVRYDPADIHQFVQQSKGVAR